MQLANDDENAEYVETACELADKDPLVCCSRLQIYISNCFYINSLCYNNGRLINLHRCMIQEFIEGVDSSNKEEGAAVDSEVTSTSKALGKRSADKEEGVAVDSEVTPTTKALGKRSADSVESLDDLEAIGCDASTTKEPKLVRVKVEKID